MDKFLGEKPNIKPPTIINFENPYGKNDASTPRSQTDTDATTSLTERSDEAEDDSFLSGTRHTKAKKKAPVRDRHEGVNLMLDAFKDKWDDDREALEESKKEDREARKEDREVHEKILEAMKQHQQVVQEAVDVLKIIAKKL